MTPKGTRPTVVVRAPLRVSLAGGGTDLPAYYRSAGYGQVCSFAIDKYVTVVINDVSQFFPTRIKLSYSTGETVYRTEHVRHPIIREALQMYGDVRGLDISVHSDVPAGTGLGSSSAFAVALLAALEAFTHREPSYAPLLCHKYALAEKACSIEIERLREPIGKQDQYASAVGGANLWKFHGTGEVTGRVLESTRVDTLVNTRLLLFYLGGTHNASQILEKQGGLISHNLEKMAIMRSQAREAAEILDGDMPFYALGPLVARGWDLKKALAPGVSNPIVDRAISLARASGATGAKLLGAGGTGFILTVCDPDKKDSVRAGMREYTEMPFKADYDGVRRLV
jgi:D-glycero-alpha-D-manno-heptose-7-phosphate kinase